MVFPKRFIDLLFVCFKDFEVFVTNNGKLSEKIQIERATKQGCPVSGIIFNLVIEILGLKLKQNTKIQLVTINATKKLLSQFADDFWTATKYSKESLEAQFDEFYQYFQFTGLKVSYDKSEIMRIGSLANTNAKIYTTLPIKWSDGPVRILGINWYPNIWDTINYNYEQALKNANQSSKHGQTEI